MWVNVDIFYTLLAICTMFLKIKKTPKSRKKNKDGKPVSIIYYRNKPQQDHSALFFIMTAIT